MIEISTLMYFLGGLALVAMMIFRKRVPQVSLDSNRRFVRFNEVEIFAHWLATVAFAFLFLSGLGFQYFVDILTKTDFLNVVIVSHEIAGYVFVFVMIAIVMMWMSAHLPEKINDAQNLDKTESSGIKKSVGKFNIGQKNFFWALVALVVVVTTSGFILAFLGSFAWLPLSHLGALHGISSILLLFLILAHGVNRMLIVKGAMSAMIDGTVDEAWVQQHYDAWYREMTRNDRGQFIYTLF
jgi:formate dehydrogenase subunit gamma